MLELNRLTAEARGDEQHLTPREQRELKRPAVLRYISNLLTEEHKTIDQRLNEIRQEREEHERKTNAPNK